MVLDKPELWRRFEQYVPAISKPGFKYLELELGEMFLVIKPYRPEYENKKRKSGNEKSRKKSKV
jgi:hypothetical protein